MSAAKEPYDKALQEYKEGRPGEAVRLLEEALRKDDRFADAYEALGLLCFENGKLEEAIVLMLELVRLEPGNIMAHANLSRFYAAKGMLEEAEKEQAESRQLSWKAELKEKSLSAGGIPDREAREAEARELEQKIETYRKIIELDPNDVLGYFSLGTVYLGAMRYGPAREAFEKAVEMNPGHSASYLGLGQALEALGRSTQAREIYRRGISVADRSGDMVPLKKMQNRLDRLEKKNGA